jgi:Ni/Fe-hydrogenase subunit HybB-like protein
VVPGWHSTIFPPYFVAGAIYSGFAMVLTIAIPLRSVYHFEDLVTLRHLEVMARIMLVTGLVVAYSYVIEHFMAWYSGDIFEEALVLNRAFGPYGWLYWLLLLFNVGVLQLLWFRRVRTSLVPLFIVSLLINVGMWIERFVIVVGSLSRDFLPAAWGVFRPTFWDWSMLIGTLGLFTALMFLFIRLLPIIPSFEMRRALHELWTSPKGSA